MVGTALDPRHTRFALAREKGHDHCARRRRSAEQDAHMNRTTVIITPLFLASCLGGCSESGPSDSSRGGGDATGGVEANGGSVANGGVDANGGDQSSAG